MDDYRTRWFTVDFYPFEENGQVPEEAIRAMSDPGPHIGYAVDLPTDWAQQVGAWWNLGHPWRQGNLWEDEVCQQTQGPAERNFLPDWEKWRLGTSDGGLVINREVWRDQIERVKQGLDPIGVTRDPGQDKMIRITADWIEGMSWDDALRLFNMTTQERLEMIAREEGQDYLHLEPSAGSLRR